MSLGSLSENATLPPEVARRVDEACDRFETAWKAVRYPAQRPRMEEYLEAVPEVERPVLLRELILLEVYYRQLAGETVLAEEYRTRFPALTLAWLDSATPLVGQGVLPAPSVLNADRVSSPEGTTQAAAAIRLRCPFCENPIQLRQDYGEEVLCPACGSTFRVQDTRFTSTASGMRQLGKFQLLERVGVGAFGAVWRARDTELDRLVALKIPHASLLTSPTDRERFAREARSAAQLRHPGIVTVYEVATLESLPAIVAEFIEGITLRELLQVRRPLPGEAALLVAQVAEALDYAHAMGLVHRDVKPANIMLEARVRDPGSGLIDRFARNDESALTPRLMDFGLALREEAEVTLTMDGQIIGTPAYMSPEQAAGQGHQVDGRSDVYSLGVILYELLCGGLPFRGSKVMIVHQVLNEEPLLPRRINPRLPRDLETICLKAMAKSPDRRYGTARELADDLRRFRNGEPIRARPTGMAGRALRWARRRPSSAGLLVVSVVAAVALVGLAVGLLYNDQLQSALQDAKKQREQADQAGRSLQVSLAAERNYLYLNRVLLAHSEWRDNNVRQAEERLDACPSDLRHWEWHYLKRLCHSDLLTLQGHKDAIVCVAFSPDGKRLATGSYDRTVILWDLGTGEQVLTLTGHADTVSSLAFSPDSKRLATAGTSDRSVKIWDLASGREIRTLLGHTGYVSSVAFSPDGKQLASAGDDQMVRVWDAATGKQLLVCTGHGNTVSSVAFSPDGSRLASGSHDRLVKIWNARTGKEIFTCAGHEDYVASVAFHPNGKQVVSGSGDRTVRIWDAESGREVLALKGHADAVSAAAFPPEGQVIASASHDRTIKLWDPMTGRELRTLKGHHRGIQGLAFSPDGKRLASASRLWVEGTPIQVAGEVKLWDAAAGQEALTYQGHAQGVNAIVFSPDSRRIASAGYDGLIKVWDPATGQDYRALQGNLGDVLCLAFSPNGKRLASGSAIVVDPDRGAGVSREVRIWDLETGRAIALHGHTDLVRGVAFSPDGNQVASASLDRTVRVWDAHTGEEIQTYRGHSSSVYSVAFSPDGKRLASASADRTVHIWDTATGNVSRILQGHGGDVVSVTFSPDGERLASASFDWTIKVWDGSTGKEIHTLKGHNAAVGSVAFSADGKRLASSSTDQTVKVWDAETGQETFTFRGHSGPVTAVAFSPSNHRLASASFDRTVRVLDARPFRIGE